MILTANSILAIYLTAAILPAVCLMIYVYKNDRADKEPAGLLISLVFMGVLAALLAIVLEIAGEKLLNMTSLTKDSATYTIVFAFAVVAAVEEGCKMLFLYLRSWKDPNFNYHYDGIVYAVFVSLGFAAFENVKYVFSYGLSVALPRALLAIPGHMTFAVIMGVFYGRAKWCEDHGKHGKAFYIVLGWFLAVLLHGTYDSCAMISTTTSTVIFVVFIIVMYLTVFRLVRKEAREDYRV